MSKRSIMMFCVIAVAFAAASSIPALADFVVKALLLDKGGIMDMSKSMGLGMGMKADMNMAIMSIEIDQKSVPAGKVTFEVTNASKETIHEMLVAPVADEDAVLPFVENENRVDEEKTGDLGEVSEVSKPGKSGDSRNEARALYSVLQCSRPLYGGHVDHTEG